MYLIHKYTEKTFCCVTAYCSFSSVSCLGSKDIYTACDNIMLCVSSFFVLTMPFPECNASVPFLSVWRMNCLLSLTKKEWDLTNLEKTKLIQQTNKKQQHFFLIWLTVIIHSDKACICICMWSEHLKNLNMGVQYVGLL